MNPTKPVAGCQALVDRSYGPFKGSFRIWQSFDHSNPKVYLQAHALSFLLGYGDHLWGWVNAGSPPVYPNPMFGWDGHPAGATAHIENRFASFEQSLVDRHGAQVFGLPDRALVLTARKSIGLCVGLLHRKEACRSPFIF